MQSIKETKKRITPVHALLSGAILGLIVMPLAFAGASPTATSSASAKKQLKALKKRVAALEGKATTPTGPAGGDLAGTYPNPLIGNDKVTTAKIANDAVTNAKVADDAVNTAEVADNAITSPLLALDSVGSEELKAARAATSAGEGVGANTVASETVNCDAGEALLGGGYAWSVTDNTANVDMSTNAPAQNPPNPVTGWTVEGESAVANTLFAWAICLDV